MSNRRSKKDSSKNQHHLVLWATACHDLRTAIYLAKNPEMTANNVGFHLQQAVEKSVKAYLSKSRISYPFTHELIQLFGLLEKRVEVPPQFDTLKMLTPFAGGFRYELPIPPDDFDATAAIDLTSEFMEWISSFGGF